MREFRYLGKSEKAVLIAWLVLLATCLFTCKASAQEAIKQDSLEVLPQAMIGDIVKIVSTVIAKDPANSPEPIVKIKASKKKRKELKALNKDLKKEKITKYQYDILEAALLEIDISKLQNYYRFKANMMK